MTQEAMTYNHAEAFCLMWYECEDRECLHRERVWNSRDGVTPFSTQCPACNGLMGHICFGRDVRALDHQPYPGQLVFVDWDRDEFVKYTLEQRRDYMQIPSVANVVNADFLNEQAIADSFQEGQPRGIRHGVKVD